MYKTASVGNYVWNDVNNNVVQDANEPGIPNVEVQLYNEAGYISSVTTDPTGFYEFTGLAPGEYVLMLVKPDGYVFSPSGQGNSATGSDVVRPSGSTAKIILATGDYNNEIDAGLFTTSNEEIPEFPSSSSNGKYYWSCFRIPAQKGVINSFLNLFLIYLKFKNSFFYLRYININNMFAYDKQSVIFLGNNL
jgi:hypothetical protein